MEEDRTAELSARDLQIEIQRTGGIKPTAEGSGSKSRSSKSTAGDTTVLIKPEPGLQDDDSNMEDAEDSQVVLNEVTTAAGIKYVAAEVPSPNTAVPEPMHDADGLEIKPLNLYSRPQQPICVPPGHNVLPWSEWQKRLGAALGSTDAKLKSLGRIMQAMLSLPVDQKGTLDLTKFFGRQTLYKAPHSFDTLLTSRGAFKNPGILVDLFTPGSAYYKKNPIPWVYWRALDATTSIITEWDLAHWNELWLEDSRGNGNVAWLKKEWSEQSGLGTEGPAATTALVRSGLKCKSSAASTARDGSKPSGKKQKTVNKQLSKATESLDSEDEGRSILKTPRKTPNVRIGLSDQQHAAQTQKTVTSQQSAAAKVNAPQPSQQLAVQRPSVAQTTQQPAAFKVSASQFGQQHATQRAPTFKPSQQPAVSKVIAPRFGSPHVNPQASQQPAVGAALTGELPVSRTEIQSQPLPALPVDLQNARSQSNLTFFGSRGASSLRRALFLEVRSQLVTRQQPLSMSAIVSQSVSPVAPLQHLVVDGNSIARLLLSMEDMKQGQSSLTDRFEGLSTRVLRMTRAISNLEEDEMDIAAGADGDSDTTEDSESDITDDDDLEDKEPSTVDLNDTQGTRRSISTGSDHDENDSSDGINHSAAKLTLAQPKDNKRDVFRMSATPLHRDYDSDDSERGFRRDTTPRRLNRLFDYSHVPKPAAVPADDFGSRAGSEINSAADDFTRSPTSDLFAEHTVSRTEVSASRAGSETASAALRRSPTPDLFVKNAEGRDMLKPQLRRRYKLLQDEKDDLQEFRYSGHTSYNPDPKAQKYYEAVFDSYEKESAKIEQVSTGLISAENYEDWMVLSGVSTQPKDSKFGYLRV